MVVQAVAGPRNDGVSIRQLVPGEAGFAARLHADALPHGFFASLGEQYLRAYYMSFLSSPHACALMADLDGVPVGLVVGPLDPEAHRSFTIRRHGARLAFQGVRALVRRPRLGVEFLGTRLRRYTKAIVRTFRPRSSRPSTEQHPQLRGRLGVLSHIAVVPDARGEGVGEALVEAFVQSARSAGLDRLQLLTLADGEGAASFYDRLGWRRLETLLDAGQHFVKYELELD